MMKNVKYSLLLCLAFGSIKAMESVDANPWITINKFYGASISLHVLADMTIEQKTHDESEGMLDEISNPSASPRILSWQQVATKLNQLKEQDPYNALPQLAAFGITEEYVRSKINQDNNRIATIIPLVGITIHNSINTVSSLSPQLDRSTIIQLLIDELNKIKL